MTGATSRLTVDGAWLYSSGPSAGAAVLASGRATGVVRRATVFTGGSRSSAFGTTGGGGGGGKLNVSDSAAHTAGAGSACFFLVSAGQINADGVAC